MLFIDILAYAIMISFFLVEKHVRQGGDAKSLQQTKYDKGSTAFLGFAFVAAYILLIGAPILNYFKTGPRFQSLPVNILGLILMAGGVSLRVAAVLTLGRFYTRTLKKTEEHALVSSGVYRYIRHPGYLGNILLFIGAGLALDSIIVFAVIMLLTLGAYLYRIQIEERMLAEIFGQEYKSYCTHTKRLLPFLY